MGRVTDTAETPYVRPLDPPGTRAVWSVLAACWLALAVLLVMRRPYGWSWMPSWVPAAMVAVAALKAVMLVAFYPMRTAVRHLVHGLCATGAITGVGLVDAAAAVEIPLLLVAVGGGQLVVFALWRRW